MNFRIPDGQGFDKSKSGAPIFIYGDPTFINNATANGNTQQQTDSVNAIPVRGDRLYVPNLFWEQLRSDITAQVTAQVAELCGPFGLSRTRSEAKVSTDPATYAKTALTSEDSSHEQSKPRPFPHVPTKGTGGAKEVGKSDSDSSPPEESNSLPSGAPPNCRLLGPDAANNFSYTLNEEG